MQWVGTTPDEAHMPRLIRLATAVVVALPAIGATVAAAAPQRSDPAADPAAAPAEDAVDADRLEVDTEAAEPREPRPARRGAGGGPPSVVEEVAAGGYVGHVDAGLGYVSGKAQVVRRRAAGVAVQVQHLRVARNTYSAVTAVGSTCLGAACTAVVSVHQTFAAYDHRNSMPYDPTPRTTVLAMLAGGSIVAGSGRVRLVIDGVVHRDQEGTSVLGYGGMRYVSRRVSADLGLVGSSDGDDIEVAPFPLANVTARW